MATICLYRPDEASHGAVTSSTAASLAQPSRLPPATGDDRLLAILDEPLAPGETAMAGFARKERELGSQFAQLSVFESRAMHARLSNPKAGDDLASKFARLTHERRTRLLAFIADARRRNAIAGRR